jgi:hypothetical protein
MAGGIERMRRCCFVAETTEVSEIGSIEESIRTRLLRQQK